MFEIADCRILRVLNVYEIADCRIKYICFFEITIAGFKKEKLFFSQSAIGNLTIEYESSLNNRNRQSATRRETPY